jgi:hypothetical protein
MMPAVAYGLVSIVSARLATPLGVRKLGPPGSASVKRPIVTPVTADERKAFHHSWVLMEGTHAMTDHAITTTSEPESKISAVREGWPAVAFSLIGLLVTLNVILYFPEWGAVIAQYNQF